MTFYKYAEREANSQIDWSAISKGLSDTITEIDTLRQEKKAAIEEETRAEIDKLANAPAGENKTATEWTLKYADDMQQYRLMLSRMLKSGQMSLKDYQIATQNGKASTEMLFKVVQEYQDEYKNIMERNKNQESSVLEPELAALNESYGNIANTSPYINPTNGMVYLANIKEGVDGVQAMGDNYVSLQALRNRIKTKIDRFDAQSAIKSKTDLLGENVTSAIARDSRFRQTGVITDITDPTIRKEYEDFQNATVKSLTVPGSQLASLMADNMVNNPRTGNQYRATYNKAEFDADKSGDLIFFGSDPGDVQFKKEQIEDARKYVKDQMKNYIDQKVEKKTFGEAGPTIYPQYEWMYAVGQEKKTQGASLNSWNQAYWGNASQKRNALNSLIGTKGAMGAQIMDIDLSVPGKISIKYEDPKYNTTKNFSPSISLGDWAKLGKEIHGIEDDTEIVRLSGGGAGKRLVQDWNDVRASRAGFDAPTWVKTNMTTEFTDRLKEFKGDTQGFASVLTAYIPPAFKGFTVRGGSDGKVYIRYPGKKELGYSVGSEDQVNKVTRDLFYYLSDYNPLTGRTRPDKKPSDGSQAPSKTTNANPSPAKTNPSYGKYNKRK